MPRLRLVQVVAEGARPIRGVVTLLPVTRPIPGHDSLRKGAVATKDGAAQTEVYARTIVAIQTTIRTASGVPMRKVAVARIGATVKRLRRVLLLLLLFTHMRLLQVVAVARPVLGNDSQ